MYAFKGIHCVYRTQLCTYMYVKYLKLAENSFVVSLKAASVYMHTCEFFPYAIIPKRAFNIYIFAGK